MNPATLPLAGLTVVAIEQAVSAPLCSRHLADLGAEVWKVERPGTGDMARSYDSVVHGESAYFVWLNRGKRSVALDLHAPDDRRRLDTMLDGADVLLHNLGPGVAERLGLDWSSTHRRWPRLIYCAISGYGRGGPYDDRRAFDLLIQGESGLLSVTGSPDAPAKVGISIADISAGMYALAATLAALVERAHGAEGRRVEISMLDAMAEWMTVPTLYQRYAKRPTQRAGLHHATIAPYGPYATKDGQTVIIAIQTEAQWVRFCEVVVQRPELADDPRFASVEQRVQHREAMDAVLVPTLSKLARSELDLRLRRADLPSAPINDLAALIDHPQLLARDRWFATETPSGPVITIRPPFGFDSSAGSVPAVGADGSAIRDPGRP
jgi:crotonobetainyl-CoA:carnitine CoA-transferase CaiB-like acyl-CoA transferase